MACASAPGTGIFSDLLSLGGGWAGVAGQKMSQRKDTHKTEVILFLGVSFLEERDNEDYIVMSINSASSARGTSLSEETTRSW